MVLHHSPPVLADRRVDPIEAVLQRLSELSTLGPVCCNVIGAEFPYFGFPRPFWTQRAPSRSCRRRACVVIGCYSPHSQRKR